MIASFDHEWNAAEALDAPHPRSVSWWRWRDGEGWTHHTRRDRPTGRRSRGSSAEPGHHLGRGTRWLT